MKSATPLDEAIAECERFLARAKNLRQFKQEPYYINGHLFHTHPSPQDTAAVRRSSMDLTKALAKLRTSPVGTWTEKRNG
jgi:hypothetical protein